LRKSPNPRPDDLSQVTEPGVDGVFGGRFSSTAGGNRPRMGLPPAAATVSGTRLRGTSHER